MKKFKYVITQNQSETIFYTVSFEPNNETQIDPIYVIQGSALSQTLPTVTRDGFSFDGWYSDSQLTQLFDDESILTSDITLYAKWTVIVYNITYLLDNGVNNENNPETYTIQSPLITFFQPTKTGYTGSFSPPSIPAGSTGNKIIQALYTANSYLVTFDKATGTGGTNSITVTYDSPMPTITPPTRDGFVFTGYFLADKKYYNSDGTSAAIWDLTSNTTLTADWLVIPVGEQVYTTPGTFTWVAPAGVTSVSVVAIGGGGAGARSTVYNASGGGGGALAWKNNYAVNPGQSYTVVVGAGASSGSTATNGQDSYFRNTSVLLAQGGRKGNLSAFANSVATGSGNSTFVGDGGGAGKSSADITWNGTNTRASGGAGAGGYGAVNNSTFNGSSGGGANGSAVGSGYQGGGTGIYGIGVSGTYRDFEDGLAGSGGNGTNPQTALETILYGGGGYGSATSSFTANAGGNGAVRIVWGNNRAFPSTNVGLTT